MLLEKRKQKKMDKKVDYTALLSSVYKQKLRDYAESFEELAKSFNEEFQTNEEDRESFLEKMKSLEQKQVMESSFREMADMISHIADEVFHYRPMEEKKRKTLIHAMRADGVYLDNLCILSEKSGRFVLGMTMYTLKKGGTPSADVAQRLSDLLKKPLQVSVTSPYLVDKEHRHFVMVEKAKYIAITGFSRAIKENETVSGDNYSILESEKGRLTILLSDGTGSGETAGKNSEQVLDLMEKMLEAGYSIKRAIHMVNTAILAKGEENNHPTLDVCSLDLYKGSCCFYKVGGVVSFLKREQEVEQIAAENLPLGIFQQIEINFVQKQLQNGDYIILITDGVLDALGNNGYEDAIQKALKEMTEQNPRQIAEKLLQIVLYCCKGRILDDMSILVIGIWENNSIT